MSKRSVLTFAGAGGGRVRAGCFTRRNAAAGDGAATEIAQWSIITAGFALAFAAGLGALGQGKAVASAAEAIARNPGAAGDIRGALILGLVLIESLVIYVLLISLILFFFNPFPARKPAAATRASRFRPGSAVAVSLAPFIRARRVAFPSHRRSFCS